MGVDSVQEMRQRLPRAENAEHLRFIRSLPCIVCHDNTSTQAAHIRFGDYKAGKRHSGLGEKPDDRFTLPMCSFCHGMQHREGEHPYWNVRSRIDPIKAAMALWLVSGDHEAGERIIAAHE